MGDQEKSNIGAIVWHDLTVDDAESVKDFYAKVVGWDTGNVAMGGADGTDNQSETYNDFTMNLPGTAETVAGVCHARGSNTKIPPQWVMYVGVEDVAASAKQCLALGGEILDGPREMAGSTYYFIKDPAGAVLAIFS